MTARSREGKRRYYERRKAFLKANGFKPCARKRCAACQRVLSRAKFYANPTLSTGLSSYCRECTRERNKRVSKRADHHPCKEKQCSRCKQIKPAASFNKARRAPDGLQGKCLDCLAIEGMCRRYGINPLELYALFDSTCGACDSCGRPHDRGKFSNIDHNHETGEVRGVLCSRCNLGMGMFDDNPALLMSAAIYLLIRGSATGGSQSPAA